MAAPPLFSLLGGWLDFQHAIPINDLTVWIPLWSVLAIAALLERPITRPADPARARRVAMVHGCSAAAITVFVAAHVVNHLAGLFGGDTHLAIMSALRTIYRHRLIEPVLIGAVLVQLVTGFELLRRKLARPARWFDTLQTASGAYLLVFLLSHTSAVFRARLRDVDTNWTWLSGGELLTDPWSARLVPYYFLAVIAFAVHGACGLRTVALGHGLSARRGEALVAVVTATSVLASALILIGLFRS